MNPKEARFSDNSRHGDCSCCNGNRGIAPNEISRRNFVKVAGTGALGTVALPGLSWSALIDRQEADRNIKERKALIVKPVFTYEIPSRREQTSWRNWGGIQTEKDAANEIARIQGELSTLNTRADFQVTFLPVSGIRKIQDLNSIEDIKSADMFIIYAAGGGMDTFAALNNMGKNIIIFCRYKSGPVYLWYEIISPRFLRQHSDVLAVKGIDEDDLSLTARMNSSGV
jgi:hypothetical protein